MTMQAFYVFKFHIMHLTILLANLLISSFLTGLIWLIQFVHYPLFKEIPQTVFSEYESKHQKLISPIVAPLMIFELLLSGWLFLTGIFQQYPVLTLIVASLNLIVFSSTIFIQAPLHRKLARQYDIKLISRLVKTNFIRTAGWTLKSILLAVIVLKYS